MTYDSATIAAIIERLPRFVLLRGPTLACHNFAHELAKYDPANRIIIQQFRDPLIDGMVQTIFDGAYLEVDYNNNPDAWDKALPVGAFPVSVGTYVEVLAQNIRNDLGLDILGRIFIRNYRNNGYHDLQPTVILKDYDHHFDVRAILDHYSQSDLLEINLGTVAFVQQKLDTHAAHNVYWIAVPEPKAQVQQFIHDRMNERQPA